MAWWLRIVVRSQSAVGGETRVTHSRMAGNVHDRMIDKAGVDLVPARQDRLMVRDAIPEAPDGL